MEARFIILFPDDPGEILSATPLIRCLRTQVDGAQVFPVVRESHQWLLEFNPHLEEQFIYREKPEELLERLQDFLPDYVIDLDGTRAVRRFKNRLKVLDFTIRKKGTADSWTARAFDTCKLFDVQDDGRGLQFVPEPLDPELLPSEFLKGYVVLSLDAPPEGRKLTDDQIIELTVMTEKPIVVTGGAGDRNLANRISQSTGCAVFPTCGDFTFSQIGSLFGGSRGVVTFDPFWNRLTEAIGTGRVFPGYDGNPANPKDIALWARSLFSSKS